MMSVIAPAASMRMNALGAKVAPFAAETRVAERDGNTWKPSSNPPAVAIPDLSSVGRDSGCGDSRDTGSALRCAFDSGTNPQVGAATADVARHCRINVGVGRPG